MEAVLDTGTGPVLIVRVKPRARRDAVTGLHATGAVAVAVRATPERGKANEAVLRALAVWLGVPRTALELLAGAGARDKRVRVSGLSATELRARVAALN